MPDYNLNAGYGRLFANAITGRNPISGKLLLVAATTDSNFNMFREIFYPDADGFARLYSTITAALAATVAGRGDKIIISGSFNTAPTLTELATAAINGVVMEVMGGMLGDAYVAQKAALALPATATGTLFTVTAPIRLFDIQGEVTTVIQAQANAVKLRAVPTVGAAVDLCATVDVNAAAVGTTLVITGTLASAATLNANGVQVAQATSIIIPAGTIGLNTAATNTGAMKWLLRYQPLAPASFVY